MLKSHVFLVTKITKKHLLLGYVRQIVTFSLSLKTSDTMRKRVYWLALLILGCLSVASVVQAQNYKRHVIQLSGVVLGEDSVSGLPGVHVYVPKAGRGTSTLITGFFSMPVLPGDKIGRASCRERV